MRGGVMMPDHLHLLVRLGETRSLSQCVARLKSKTRMPMASHFLEWQANFYEHRLRPDEDPSAVLQYLFLNPYRAGLVKLDQVYAWFWLGAEEAAWFTPTTDDGRPFAEWLR